MPANSFHFFHLLKVIKLSEPIINIILEFLSFFLIYFIISIVLDEPTNLSKYLILICLKPLINFLHLSILSFTLNKGYF